MFNFYISNDIYEQQILIIFSQKHLEFTHLHAFPIAIDIFPRSNVVWIYELVNEVSQLVKITSKLEII